MKMNSELQAKPVPRASFLLSFNAKKALLTLCPLIPILSRENTVNAADCTVNAEDYTVNAKDYTVNAKDYTVNAKDYTVKAKDYTLTVNLSKWQYFVIIV